LKYDIYSKKRPDVVEGREILANCRLRAWRQSPKIYGVRRLEMKRSRAGFALISVSSLYASLQTRLDTSPYLNPGKKLATMIGQKIGRNVNIEPHGLGAREIMSEVMGESRDVLGQQMRLPYLLRIFGNKRFPSSK
jgi:hypothetical protein